MPGSELTPGFPSSEDPGEKEQKIAFPVAGLRVEQQKRHVKQEQDWWNGAGEKLRVNLANQTLSGCHATLL